MIIIFSFLQARKLNWDKLTNCHETAQNSTQMNWFPTWAFSDFSLTVLLGEKRIKSTLRRLVSFVVTYCLWPPSSKASVLITIASHPFIVETENYDYICIYVYMHMYILSLGICLRSLLKVDV